MFCSEKHSQRYRDRQRYHADVERQHERSRRYYAEHREEVLARSQAKRDAKRGPQPPRFCSECGEPLEGRSRVVCLRRRCKERRWRRLNPEAYQDKERKKVVRRREARRKARAA